MTRKPAAAKLLAASGNRRRCGWRGARRRRGRRPTRAPRRSTARWPGRRGRSGRHDRRTPRGAPGPAARADRAQHADGPSPPVDGTGRGTTEVVVGALPAGHFGLASQPSCSAPLPSSPPPLRSGDSPTWLLSWTANVGAVRHPPGLPRAPHRTGSPRAAVAAAGGDRRRPGGGAGRRRHPARTGARQARRPRPRAPGVVPRPAGVDVRRGRRVDRRRHPLEHALGDGRPSRRRGRAHRGRGAARGQGRRRVLRRAPARSPRHADGLDGVLPRLQHRRRRCRPRRRRRAGVGPRLRRPPRQRHPGGVRRGPAGAVRQLPPVAAVPGHGAGDRDRDRRRERDDDERAAAAGRDRATCTSRRSTRSSPRSSSASRRRGC